MKESMTEVRRYSLSVCMHAIVCCVNRVGGVGKERREATDEAKAGGKKEKENQSYLKIALAIYCAG